MVAPVRVDSAETVFHFAFVFEAILFPHALPAEMLSCDAARHRPCRSFSQWQSDDPTQRFSGASIKRTQPVSAAAHLCSFIPIKWLFLMELHQWLHLLLSRRCLLPWPWPHWLLITAHRQTSYWRMSSWRGSWWCRKVDQLRRVRSYSSPPKVSAVLAGLTSGADSLVKVNDRHLLMSPGRIAHWRIPSSRSMGRRSVWIKSQLDHSGRHSRLISRIVICPSLESIFFFILVAVGEWRCLQPVCC